MYTEHDIDGTLLYVSVSYDETKYTKDYKGMVPHRLGGPAKKRGNIKEYWMNGQRHRIGKPAIYGLFVLEYWEYGKLHRLDGPAVTDLRSRHKSIKTNVALCTDQYYVRGKRFDNETEFNRFIARETAAKKAKNLESLYSL